VSVAVTDQSWNEDAVSTCGPAEPVHGSWLTPSRFGDACCPVAKPGAWPEDAPASQEPQPDVLVDPLAGQLAVYAVPPVGACDGVCDAVGSVVGADVVGAGVVGAVPVADVTGAGGVGVAVWVGAAVDCVAVGWVVGGEDVFVVGPVFDGVGPGLMEAEVVDSGAVAVVTGLGELPAIGSTPRQPAVIPMISEVPKTTGITLRTSRTNRTPIPI
jgi:hypothetical protein